MRFLKVLSITLVAIILTASIIIAIAYTSRVSLINHFISSQLNLAPLELTCIDFHFTDDKTIIIDDLCLDTNKAKIAIQQAKLQWQLFPQPKVTAMDIASLNIKGTDHLFNHIEQTKEITPDDSPQSTQQFIAEFLDNLTKQITTFKLPFNLTIKAFSYLPFSPSNAGLANTVRKETYQGTVSVLNNTINFLLQDSQSNTFINAQFTQRDNKPVIVLSSQLAPLKSFVDAHQLPISSSLDKMIKTTEIAGQTNTEFTFETNKLLINNQITGLELTPSKNMKQRELVALSGLINIQTTISVVANKDATIVTFINNNALTVALEQPEILKFLADYNVSPQIMSLLRNNPIEQIIIAANNKTTLALTEEKITLDHLTLTAKGDNRPHTVNLEDMAMNLPFNSQVFSVKTLTLDSPLKIDELAPYTSEPVIIHLVSSLDSSQTQTTLHFLDKTLVTSSLLEIPLETKEAPKNTKKSTSLPPLQIKTLSAKLNGSINLPTDGPLTVDLAINTNAKQVQIPKQLQLNSMNSVSKITGQQDNINIHNTLTADNINLGTQILTGSLTSPNVQLMASNIQLTDLLSLNIKLPTKISLIDGILDYDISGEITDLTHIKNSNFSVEVAVNSLSGEIDGTWLQELNWHQHFTLLDGTVTTQSRPEKNLTIALIDTPTPISELSLNTGLIYGNDLSLSASEIKGNILGGSFSIPKIQWPFVKDHSVDVQLNSIDLEQVLALDKKQGIVVTGNISGILPISFDGKRFNIEQGKLYNINNGLIQVVNNPAVMELKASNSELQLAFDALQNLHYHQLSSDVSMSDDGYMLLETIIKGRNPDIDNDVNLNLNLSYDLLGLLKSLSITESFEENIIKGLQTH
ncbi:intermembrane phospholipid transport protein YdbH family protein [Thalassotalea piscium]